MRPGGWPSILAVYLYGVLGVACLSKMLPLAADFDRALGVGPTEFAILLSLLALPPALLAAIGGAIVDRVGARRALIWSALLGAAIDGAYCVAPSLVWFQVLRVGEGLTMMGVFTAAPALLMATTVGPRRVSAMTLWSTYTPTGFSLGLVLAAGFAGSSNWRATFLLHGALFVLAALIGLRLPAPAASGGAPVSLGARVRGLLAIYTQVDPVRLSLMFGCVITLGLGVSIVTPSFLGRNYHLTIAEASELLAAANFTMILGALLVSAWLGRGGRAVPLYMMLATIGALSGTVLFASAMPFAGAVVALCIWLFAAGAATAFALAVLPGVVADPTQGAAAAGLFSQVSSIVTLLTPPLWLGAFGETGGSSFIVLIIGFWVLSVVLLPGTVRRFGPMRAGSPAAH